MCYACYKVNIKSLTGGPKKVSSFFQAAKNLRIFCVGYIILLQIEIEYLFFGLEWVGSLLLLHPFPPEGINAIKSKLR